MISTFSRKMLTSPVLFRICAGSYSYLEFESTRAKSCQRDKCSTTLCPPPVLMFILPPSPLCSLNFEVGILDDPFNIQPWSVIVLVTFKLL